MLLNPSVVKAAVKCLVHLKKVFSSSSPKKPPLVFLLVVNNKILLKFRVV